MNISTTTIGLLTFSFLFIGASQLFFFEKNASKLHLENKIQLPSPSDPSSINNSTEFTLLESKNPHESDHDPIKGNDSPLAEPQLEQQQYPIISQVSPSEDNPINYPSRYTAKSANPANHFSSKEQLKSPFYETPLSTDESKTRPSELQNHESRNRPRFEKPTPPIPDAYFPEYVEMRPYNASFITAYNRDIRPRRTLLPLYFNVSLQHLEGKGIGYSHGYTTLGLFCTPYSLIRPLQPFLDTRFHLLNNGEKAFNLGVGARFTNLCLRKVFGCNLYYDFRHSQKDYHQIGLGAEMLGCEFDLRANAYLPVGKQSRRFLKETLYYQDGFWARHYNKKGAMTGFDAEIETSLSKCYRSCYEWNPFIAVGPYYFNGEDHRHVRGGRIRLGVNYVDILKFELRTSFDNVYHTIVQGVFTLSIPFTIFDKCCRRDSSCTACYWPMLTQPVQRNEIIAIDHKCLWQTNFPRHDNF